MAKKKSEDARAALFGCTLIIGLILIAIVGPVMGSMRMVRGYRRGFFGTIFATVILNLLIWGLGALVLTTVAAILVEESENSISVFLGAPLAGLTGLGFLIGILQRPGRKRQFAIEEENEIFLVQHGIRETGGKDITHIDSNNNNLRLLEENDDMLVFMAVGRRGKRAYINLNQDGKMIEYTGIS